MPSESKSKTIPDTMRTEQNMKTGIRAFLMGIFLLSVTVIGASGQTSPPRLFFTDIITGAKTGGENNNGVYLTIYGKGFGASRGSSTVTIGGGAPAQYKIWGQNNSINTMLDMIVVQIGPGASTGNVVVTVNGKASNGLPFTVSAGNIFFVAPGGNDGAAGTIGAPWLNPSKARTTVAAGDTVYFRAGTYTSIDNDGAVMECNSSCNGTPTAYVNFLGYPGETATLGNNAAARGIYHWAASVWNYATIAELTLRGQQYGMTCQNVLPGGACNFIRLVGNDMRSLDGGSTAFDMEMPVDHISVYGNESAQNCLGASNCSFDQRAYSMYFGGYGAQTNIDIGWNRLHDNPFGKGIQIYGHIAGDTITHLVIHDNQIYNNTMTGIALGGSDGNTDFIQDATLYNNLIWNNSNGSGADHMIFGGIELNGLNSSDGVYTIYNNTFYQNSPAHSGVNAGGEIAFATTGPKSVALQNNIFYASSGSPCYLYFDDQSAASAARVTFSNNVYFNAGNGPGGCNYNVGAIGGVGKDAKAISANPSFVAASSHNFHLASNSPAIDAGLNTGLALDFDGVTRPQGSGFDIGAYEFASGSSTSTQPPAPPTNLRVTVQ
jgi:IPT/TIG domain